MSDLAIRVENLSKRYKIGVKQERYKTLRDTLAQAFTAPFRRFDNSPLKKGARGMSFGNPKSEIPNPALSTLDSQLSTATDTIWALKDFSFEVKRGEVVGIIGRNGAGKSTLLKVLSRITEPTKGFAEIHGRVGSLLEVGTGFHLELSGRENIYLNGAILGMKKSEIDLKFDEIVAFAEVEKFIDTPVKHYSSGMYLRLAFAVAAHLEPDILLVDEVLAVGDVSFQEKCLGRMSEVAHGGRPVLFVSHSMSAIALLCERVIWLDRGSLRDEGNPAQVIQRYIETAYTAIITQEGLISLLDRLDRRGDGALSLTHIRLLDGSDAQTPYLKTGQNAKIAIGYKARNGANLGTVTIGLTILNSRHQYITACSNKYVGTTFRDLPPVGELLCEFRKLPLVPGRYTLNVKCKVGPSVADHLQHAGWFNVIEGEFYPTKLLPAPGYGDALFEHHWSLRNGLKN